MLELKIKQFNLPKFCEIKPLDFDKFNSSKECDSMLSKKNFITHLLAISILCIGFLLCRYVFFGIHGMKQMPVLLLGLGMLFVVVSFFLKCKVAPIVIALGYMIGFVAGVVFETDGVDAGGASMNNLWIIWTMVFVGFVVLGGFVEKIFKHRDEVNTFLK